MFKTQVGNSKLRHLLKYYAIVKVKLRMDDIKSELQFDIAHWRSPPKMYTRAFLEKLYYDTVKIRRLSLESKIVSERLLDSIIAVKPSYQLLCRVLLCPKISYFMTIASFRLNC